MRLIVLMSAALCGLALSLPVQANDTLHLPPLKMTSFNIDIGGGTPLKVTHWHGDADDANQADAQDIYQIASDKLGGVPAVGSDLAGAITAFTDAILRKTGIGIPHKEGLPAYIKTSHTLMLGPYKVTVDKWDAAARNDNESFSSLFQISSDTLGDVPLVGVDFPSAVVAFSNVISRMQEVTPAVDNLLTEMATPTHLNDAAIVGVTATGKGADKVFQIKLEGLETMTFLVPEWVLADDVKLDAAPRENVALSFIRTDKPGTVLVLDLVMSGG